MAEITAASNEQSDGISQVNQAIAKMDEATQQNAALVEQAAAAAGSMRDQANNLNHAVGIFKVQANEAVVQPTVAAPPRAVPRAAVHKPKAPLKAISSPSVARKSSAAAKTDEWEEF